jgi:hypothetical protein
MAVEILLSRKGQSLLEFLLMLPVMFGMAALLIKFNTTIQVSIVNQQYARAQTLWLAFNSPVYPYLDLREDELTSGGFNQMLIGVSDNAAPEEGEGQYVPKASVQNISRRPSRGLASDANQQEPTERSMVRVRSTVTLCTQANVVAGAGRSVPILPLDGGRAAGPSNLTEGSRFEFCKSPLEYL